MRRRGSRALWLVAAAVLATASPGVAAAHAIVSNAGGPACPQHRAGVATAAVRGPTPRSATKPDANRARFAARVGEAFFWIRRFSRPTVPVCAFRTSTGLPIPLCCRDNLRRIAARLGVPLWVMERLNPRHRDVRLGHGHRVLVPAVRESIRKWCFLPVREWRDDDMPPEREQREPRRTPVRRHLVDNAFAPGLPGWSS